MNVAYWEKRYAAGGHSGDGSRGSEAEWKAALVSEVARVHRVRSIVDFGAGDGHVAARLVLPADCSYLGVEPSPSARKLATAAAPALEFVAVPPPWSSDLALSMDVVFHLTTEPDRRAYFAKLFGLAERFVLIYGTCDDRTGYAPHVTHYNWRPFIPEPWHCLQTWDVTARGFKQAWLLGRVAL